MGYLLRKHRTDRGLSVCDLYQITDPAERERLMALAREGKQRAWWQPYALPYATYVGLEAEATSIRDYNSDLVTGSLQVESYARAIFEANEPPLDDATIEQRAEARSKRQALLRQERGPLLHCILDEGALRRPVGGAAVMRVQLERIIEVAGWPRVETTLRPGLRPEGVAPFGGSPADVSCHGALRSAGG